MIRRWSYCLLFLFICLLSACGGKDNETVDYNQISPNSKPRKERPKAIDTIKDEKPKQSVFLKLMDSIRPNALWQKWDTLLFPDRFGAKNAEKWIVKNEKDSVVLLYFKFTDSLLTKNAFFNWIDCFGPKCNAYTVGANIKVKGKYAYFFVGATEIYYLESLKSIDQEGIRDQIAGLNRKKTPKKENWLFVMESKPKGKAIWKKVKNGEELEIKNSYENIE